jgi:hypothetical protein
MLEFTEPFKIYLFKPQREVKLSIMVSRHVVDTYRVQQDSFEQLMSACADPQGASIQSHGVEWWAQHKHRGRPSEYVRISAWFAGASRDYRSTRSQIDLLCAEYDRQKHNRMPWDSGSEERQDG